MRSSGGHGPRRKETVRCAIYTRKSSEEGLEQEFNSLQAQREACEAFITSQRHEGWACLPKTYDDGGFSGATMDRTALQRLLADIAAGRVDAVVVYKIDRLTRSLADFAKIVEILDARSASFVGSDEVPLAALAEREGVSPSYFTRLVRLSYLAPDITHAILDGRQPRDLTAEKLLEHSRLPLAWHDQRTALGF